MSSEIQVRLENGTLTLTPRIASFRSNEPVTWIPMTGETTVQAIALRLSDTKLPRFKEISVDPITGVLTARAVGVAQKSAWAYLLQVNGDWYSQVSSTGASMEDPEEPPELVNETPDAQGG